MAEAEDIIKKVCSMDEISNSEEWVSTPEDLCRHTNVVITLGRYCRESFSVAVDAEIRALIDENSRPGDMVVYTDGSVKRGSRSS